MKRIGIQIGVNELVGVVLSPDGRVIENRSVAVAPDLTYDQLLEQVVLFHENLSGHSSRHSTGVGVCVPGRIEGPQGVVVESAVACLVGKQVGNDLTFMLQRDVHADGEANCLTLAEATFGAGRRMTMVVGLVAGTPMQGALVIHGQLWRGRNAKAGAWNRLPGMKELKTPGRAQRAERQFRRAMLGIGTLLDPDIIVMSGLPSATPLFRGVFESGVPLVAPALGARASAIGAALVGV